jgi:hypothetical protein
VLPFSRYDSSLTAKKIVLLYCYCCLSPRRHDSTDSPISSFSHVFSFLYHAVCSRRLFRNVCNEWRSFREDQCSISLHLPEEPPANLPSPQGPAAIATLMPSVRRRSNFVEAVEVKQCAALSFCSCTSNSINSSHANWTFTLNWHKR